MIRLNNLFKLLFLLILFSCTVTTNNEKKEKLIVIDKDLNKPYFSKSKVDLSNLGEYEIDFTTIEGFIISNELEDFEISHKDLPYPSVVRVSNPESLNNYLIVKNIKNLSKSKVLISNNIAKKLNVKSRIYIEYLKEESIRLRGVEDSKEQSKVKMDQTEISFENLDEVQNEKSSGLDLDKINAFNQSIQGYEGIIFIESFNSLSLAKLKTNKIANLGLIYENIDDQFNVLAGPFTKEDINLKLDFLIRNGYGNAEIYR